MLAKKESLLEVDEIGDRIAYSLIDFFADEANRSIIQRLQDFGLCFKHETTKIKLSENLIGKSIVVSGVFSSFSREQLKEMIEQHGGKNVTSISAKTDFVIAGENMGPAKLEKAIKLGVKILNEVEFIQLVNTY